MSNIRGRGLGLKPRQRAYDNSTHGKSGGGLIPGDFTVKQVPGVRMTMVRGKSKEGPLVMRPWPCRDYDKPNEILVPGRLNTNPLGQNEWIVKATGVKYFGIPGKDSQPITMLLFEPHLAQQKRQDNPAIILFYAAKQAFKSGKFNSGGSWRVDWNRLMQGDDKGGAALSAPTGIAFMQGEVLVNGDTDYTLGEKRQSPLGSLPDDPLTIVQISGGTYDNLLSMLDRPKANVPDDVNLDDEPWKNFVFGDPVGHYNAEKATINGGLIFSFFNPKKMKLLPHPSDKTKRVITLNGVKVPIDNTSWDGVIPSSGIIAPHVAAGRKFKNEARVEFSADLTPDQVDNIFKRQQFWWDDEQDPATSPGVLQILPNEEQALLIAKAFKPVPDLLRFAWQDRDNLLTNDVEGVLRERRSAVVPGRAGDGEGDGEVETQAAPAPRRGRVDPSVGAAPAGRGRGRPKPPQEELVDEFNDDASAGESTEVSHTDAGEFEEDQTAGAVDETPADPAAVDEFDTTGEAEASGETAEADADATGESLEDVSDDDLFGLDAGGTDTAAPEVVEDDLFGVDDDATTDAPPADDAAGVEADAGGTDEFNEEENTDGATVDGLDAELPEGTGEEAQTDEDPNEARMRQSMETAKSRAGKRVSQQPAAPTPPPPAPAPAARRPAAAPVKTTTAAAGKPAARPAAAAAAPAKPAAVAARPAAAPAKPAAVAARPAAAPTRPAAAAGPTRPAAAAAARPAAAPAKPAAAAARPAAAPARPAAAPARPAAAAPAKPVPRQAVRK